MIYAKLLNEREIELAPDELLINARKYVGFTQDFMASQGYKPVVHTFPQHTTNALDEKQYEMYYIESEQMIKQAWREVPEATD